MKATQRRTRSGSEAGLVGGPLGSEAGGPGVEPAGDARDRAVAEALADGPVPGLRPDAERLRRFFIVSVSEDADGELQGV